MKTIYIAGASGLVGQALLAQCLEDASVGAIYAAVRRPLGFQHPRLHELPMDVGAAALSALTIHEAYICLGTTLKTAGSQAAFKAVDVDLVVRTAQQLRSAGVSRCAVVSSLGASNNGGFYLRCKAQMEAAVAELGFARTVFARPSFLAGQRAELRLGERIALALSAVLRPLIPKKVRPVQAATVAAAMRRGLSSGDGLYVLENEAL